MSALPGRLAGASSSSGPAGAAACAALTGSVRTEPATHAGAAELAAAAAGTKRPSRTDSYTSTLQHTGEAQQQQPHVFQTPAVSATGPEACGPALAGVRLTLSTLPARASKRVNTSH